MQASIKYRSAANMVPFTQETYIIADDIIGTTGSKVTYFEVHVYCKHHHNPCLSKSMNILFKLTLTFKHTHWLYSPLHHSNTYDHVAIVSTLKINIASWLPWPGQC